MAAVGLGSQDVSAYLVPGVAIGCDNSPSSTTITGDQKQLDMVMENIRTAQLEVLVRRLRVEVAYHSYHMMAVAIRCETLLQEMVPQRSPRILFFSSVTGNFITDEAGVLGPSYSTQNLVSPVLFFPAVSAIVTNITPRKVFLEIRPHSALAGPVRQILRPRDAAGEYLPILARNNLGREGLLRTVGASWIKNVSIDFSAMNKKFRILKRSSNIPMASRRLLLDRESAFQRMAISRILPPPIIWISYTGKFAGMSTISTNPIAKVPVATARQRREEEQSYTIHPVSLDCTLQLFTVAAYEGLARKFRIPAISSYIEELSIRQPKDHLLMHARADVQPNGTISGDLIAVSADETVIVMKGLRLSSIGDSVSKYGDPHAAAQLIWKEDLNLLDASQLIRPLTNRAELHELVCELCLVCAVETYQQLEDMKIMQPHHRKYRQWISTQSNAAVGKSYIAKQDCASSGLMCSEERTTEYIALDISKDPINQGFESESFDLIIACNTLHCTPSLIITLKLIRKLLHPGGHLLLQGIHPSIEWIKYIFGVLPDFWLNRDDEVLNEPYLMPEEWHSKLTSAGSQRVDHSSEDGNLNHNLLAIPIHSKRAFYRVTVLYHEFTNQVIEIDEELSKAGYGVDYCMVDQVPAPHQDTVALLDISKPYLHSATSVSFDALKRFIVSIDDSGVLWVTGASQIACQDPDMD
ncbi:MAG: hypothetical protein Q9178_000466 [Gyalolechia marmorata]